MKKIIIGCDRAGMELKDALVKLMEDSNIEYEDIGVYSNDDQTLYPNVAEVVSQKIIDSGYKDNGILICGTGIGMSISANKFKGIHATVCHDIYSAERAKLSNNTNVISLGQRVIGIELAKVIVSRWIELEFIPSHSSGNIDRIKELENQNFKKINK